jgi:hypothetical protein
MIDWNQVVTNLLLGIGSPTVLGYLIVQLVRRHRGKLTRASIDSARAERAERLAARYLAFIWLLLAHWPEGHPRPPWPRGLKPKD